MDDSQTLSDYAAGEIRAVLARNRSTGKELAEKLGFSRSWVSYRLTGTTEITLNDLQRIAAALDVDVSALLPTPTKQSESGNMSPSSLMAGRTTTTLTSRPTRGRYAPHVSGVPVQGHEPAWACETVIS